MARVAREVPPPATYNPEYTQVENTKFNKIGFGIGQRMANEQILVSAKKSERMFVHVPRGSMGTSSPGPGTYKIPSTFEKYNTAGSVHNAITANLNLMSKYYSRQQPSTDKITGADSSSKSRSRSRTAKKKRRQQSGS